MKISRRKLLLTATTASIIAYTDIARSRPQKKINQPNIIMIVVDDMRFDEWGLGGHPFLETPALDALAKRGIVFSKAYQVTPLCSPNRACLLTGQYTSRHGIIDNAERNLASHRLDLFAKDLQKAGYFTGHIGKWHMGNDPTPRPGYDYWVCLPGQGKANDSPLYENGKVSIAPGYITDVLTDRAVQFIENRNEKPFFCYIGHKALHPNITQLDSGAVDFSDGAGFIPAPRHRGIYDGKVYPRSKSFGPPKGRTKPVVRELLAIKQSKKIKDKWQNFLDPLTSDNTIEKRAEMMLSVDEGLARIVKSLKQENILDKTVIIFTSDNGYFFGEHGLSIERRLPYEENVRAPLVIAGPNVVTGECKNSLVSSVDIAPTILELARAPIPEHIQGISFKPILGNLNVQTRHSAYLEYYSHEIPMPWTVDLDYKVVIQGPYKLIAWLQWENVDELYNIDEDPYELTNLIDKPTYTQIKDKLYVELRRSIVESFRHNWT